MCFLLNLATDLDEDFAEVNIHDLVDTTISAFAQLLLSKNKMKVGYIYILTKFYLLLSSSFTIYSLFFPYLEFLSKQGFCCF